MTLLKSVRIGDKLYNRLFLEVARLKQKGEKVTVRSFSEEAILKALEKPKN